jgi:hypothetical protein
MDFQSPDNAAAEAHKLLHKQPSHALSLLEVILTSRHQPWCSYQGRRVPSGVNATHSAQDIGASIENLEEAELARALVRACLHGDLDIAQAIWSIRGPFEIHHEHRQHHEVINGTAVRQGTEASHLLTNAKSIKDLDQLMGWMPTVGLGFMVGVGSEHALLLESAWLEEPIKALAHKVSYAGALPILSEGAILHPELVIALQEKQRSSGLTEAFEDILCWVPDEEVANFPDHLKPFEVNQGLHLIRPRAAGDAEPYFHREMFALEQCTEELISQVSTRSVSNATTQNHPGVWDMDYLELRVTPKNDLISSYPSNVVLGYQASKALQFGFDHKPGHTLCHTSVDFLSGFQVCEVDRERYKEAAAFTENYFPLDILSMKWEGPEKFFATCLRKQPGFYLGRGKVSAYSNIMEFYRAFGNDSEIRDQIRSALPRPLVNLMMQLNCTTNLDLSSMLALQQGLGIDNEGFGAQLDSLDLQKLHDAGYRFSDQTVTQLPQRYSSLGRQLTYERLNSSDTEVYLNLAKEQIHPAQESEREIRTRAQENAFHNALRMNLWPAEEARPESLRHGIIQAARKKPDNTNFDRALRAWFDIEGVENCLKAADSVSQVDFLRRHFGHTVVKPLLNLTSRKIRAKLLEDDLGL